MKLYSGPLSLFARKVEIALREKGLDFDRVMVPFTQAEGYFPKHPDVLRANPKGQVPVLVDGELTLFDSTLINEYLDDAYPEPPILPRSPALRARCRLLELTADEVMLPLVVRLMYRTEPPDPDPAIQHARELDGTRAEAEIGEFYKMLEESLTGQKHFCGTFSVADIGVLMTLVFAKRLDAPGFGDNNELSAWFERVAGRASVEPVLKEIEKADRALAI